MERLVWRWKCEGMIAGNLTQKLNIYKFEKKKTLFRLEVAKGQRWPDKEAKSRGSNKQKTEKRDKIMKNKGNLMEEMISFKIQNAVRHKILKSN